MVASCTNWDLKFKEKPLILFSLCSGSKYSCLSQDRIGITAVGDKEVKGTNSVKDQWKLLTQEGPVAEISWITQLNKLSGKSIWISSSWAVSDMWASHSHGLAGESWTFQSPSALPEDGAEAEALGTQRCCWGWGCWGSGFDMAAEQAAQCCCPPALGTLRPWPRDLSKELCRLEAAGEGPVNPESSRCRNERGNHNCK